MSLKTSLAKYVHFGSNHVVPEQGPKKEKTGPRKEPTRSILGDLTNRLSPSRDKRADGNAAVAAKQYRIGASARTRQETGTSVRGQKKAGKNEGLTPELQARFQALRGGPVPSDKELFARFEALKTPTAKKPAAASDSTTTDLKMLTQQLKKTPGPTWSAQKSRTDKTGSRPAPSSTTAKPARAALLSNPTPGTQSSGKKMQAQGRMQSTAPNSPSTRPASAVASSPTKKPSSKLSLDDFHGLADIKRRPGNSHKQSVKPFSHFEEEEALRADNANERPSKAQAEERYNAQFFSTPASPGRSNAGPRTRPAASSGTGSVSGQSIRRFDEFWEEEQARADDANEYPSEKLAKERYQAQFAPEPAKTRRQNTPQGSRPTRSESSRSDATSNASERVIMPLSHFEKMEDDEAAQFHRHKDPGAALDAYLRQFD